MTVHNPGSQHSLDENHSKKRKLKVGQLGLQKRVVFVMVIMAGLLPYETLEQGS